MALADAIEWMRREEKITCNPLLGQVASISVGIVQGEAVIDLDYMEDSQAHTDMNVVMNDSLHFIEIQGTAENEPFSGDQLLLMLELAKLGTQQLINHQRKILKQQI